MSGDTQPCIACASDRKTNARLHPRQKSQTNCRSSWCSRRRRTAACKVRRRPLVLHPLKFIDHRCALIKAAWTDIRCTTNSPDCLASITKTESPTTFRNILLVTMGVCRCCTTRGLRIPLLAEAPSQQTGSSAPALPQHTWPAWPLQGTQRPEKTSTEQRNHPQKAMMVALMKLTQWTRWTRKAP